MNISNHAVERYAQRIMGKYISSISELSQEEIDQIRKKLESFIVPENLLYEGMPFTQNGKTTESTNIYLNGVTVVIYDSKGEAIITVYSVDLGFDEALNKKYVSALKDKISMVKTIANIQLSNYRDIIANYKEYIADYEKSVKDAEKRIIDYKENIKRYEKQVEEAEDEAKLISKTADDEIKQLVYTMIKKK